MMRINHHIEYYTSSESHLYCVYPKNVHVQDIVCNEANMCNYADVYTQNINTHMWMTMSIYSWYRTT